LFDYGELRLLVLALIAEQPAHGYELIKIIEERFGGSYTPSPGVIYPTLSWLEDMGYARVEPKEGGRKS
jgi:DNA-binding PadR family transcriptional regulator